LLRPPLTLSPRFLHRAQTPFGAEKGRSPAKQNRRSTLARSCAAEGVTDITVGGGWFGHFLDSFVEDTVDAPESRFNI
jgi:hypothetical protein